MYRHLSRKRQLFINDDNVEVGRSESNYGCHNVKRVLHQPKKHGLVLMKDRPWESPVIDPVPNGILFDEQSQKFKCWYSCFFRQWYQPCAMEVESGMMLYAESNDGIQWQKPALDTYENNGSKANNICLTGPGCGILMPNVLYDSAESDPDRRYKLLCHGTVGTDHGPCVYFSPDGLRWTPYEHNPILYSRVDCGDTHALMGCRDPRTGKFVATIRPQDWYLSYPNVPSYRYRRGDPQAHSSLTYAYRNIGLSFSDDFTQWTIPETIIKSDLDDPLGTQFQMMTLMPYEDLYLGFLGVHYTDGANDTVDIQLAVSPDIHRWQRVGQRKPFLAIGDEGPWQSRMIFSVCTMPVRVKDELWFYYSPHKTNHYAKHEDRVGALGLAKMRLDGFVSIYVGDDGFLLTKPFTFTGQSLCVNADASQGSLRVQITDECGQVIENYLSRPIYADGIASEVLFEKDVARLRGRPIRLKFLMKHVHLYSFCFS